MSIWSRIMDAVQALARGEGLGAAFDRLRPPPEGAPERSVAFTIAVIALGAKMAKADGAVTRDEVTAFRRIFRVPPGDEAHAARVFNLARQDVAGYDLWAARIRAMFQGEAQVLEDVIEGLFAISVADGHHHPAEAAFLADVARIFQMPQARFRAIRAAYVEGAKDPWEVLGVAPDQGLEAARAAWKQAVRECHPDRLRAAGVPDEALGLAEARLVAVNAAWEAISARERELAG